VVLVAWVEDIDVMKHNKLAFETLRSKFLGKDIL